MKLLLMDKGIGIGNRLEFQAEKFISVFVESGKEKEKDVAKAIDHLISSRLFRTLKNRYDLDKANMLKEAPFTIGLPDVSPDRFAQFLGWQMVRNYMNKNKITLEQLIAIPYNNILQEYEIVD